MNGTSLVGSQPQAVCRFSRWAPMQWTFFRVETMNGKAWQQSFGLRLCCLTPTPVRHHRLTRILRPSPVFAVSAPTASPLRIEPRVAAWIYDDACSCFSEGKQPSRQHSLDTNIIHGSRDVHKRNREQDYVPTSGSHCQAVSLSSNQLARLDLMRPSSLLRKL